MFYTCLWFCSRGSLSRGSLSRGISVQGGFCQGDPPYGNVLVARILMECILVSLFSFALFCIFSSTTDGDWDVLIKTWILKYNLIQNYFSWLSTEIRQFHLKNDKSPGWALFFRGPEGRLPWWPHINAVFIFWINQVTLRKWMTSVMVFCL